MYINEDKTSVTYDPENLTLFDVGIQHFKYRIEVAPMGTFTREGMVDLDFRVTPAIYPKCENGYPVVADQEKVKQTEKR